MYDIEVGYLARLVYTIVMYSSDILDAQEMLLTWT